MFKKYFYRELIWKCGCYMDVEIFPVYQRPGVRRSKCKPSSEIQRHLNQRHAEKHLIRLVHLNFAQNDYAIGLDYTSDCLPRDEEQAKRDISNYLRRLKRLYKRYEVELKYVMSYEKTLKADRAHFHLIVNNAGIPWEVLLDVWKYGRTNIKALQFNDKGVVGMSLYVAKKNEFGKRWCASKNLVQPKRPQPRDYKLTPKIANAIKQEDHTEIRKIYGETLNIAECDFIHNGVNQGDYIYIRMFDYTKFSKQTGHQPYQRKLKNDKSAARTHAGG